MKHPKGTVANRVDIYMTRVIYPVGLGAFCIERFCKKDDNSVLFNMMYDCGSLSGMSEAIQYETQLLYEDKPLDLVCISHFDEDHINGFRKLLGTNAIKAGYTTILLPQIFDYQYILELIGVDEYVNYSELRYDLYSSEYRVIEVLPIEGEIQAIESDGIDLNDIPRQVASGTPITILNRLWKYVPFNNFDRQKNRKLLDDLMARTGFSAQKINDIHNGIITTEDLKQLKDAYRQLGRTEKDVTFINQNSLLLLSKDIVFCYAHLLYSNAWINTTVWTKNQGLQHPFNHRSCGLNASCLYTGDSVMDQKLVDIQKAYMGDESIGLFQIPHHGSRHCYDDSVMKQLNIHAAFVNTDIYSDRVSLEPNLEKWQYHDIVALFWVLKGNGGIYEYIY